jgi:hypothetical protein
MLAVLELLNKLVQLPFNNDLRGTTLKKLARKFGQEGDL